MKYIFPKIFFLFSLLIINNHYSQTNIIYKFNNAGRFYSLIERRICKIVSIFKFPKTNSIQYLGFLPIIFLLYWSVLNKFLYMQNLLSLVENYFFPFSLVLGFSNFMYHFFLTRPG